MSAKFIAIIVEFATAPTLVLHQRDFDDEAEFARLLSATSQIDLANDFEAATFGVVSLAIALVDENDEVLDAFVQSL